MAGVGLSDINFTVLMQKLTSRMYCLQAPHGEMNWSVMSLGRRKEENCICECINAEHNLNFCLSGELATFMEHLEGWGGLTYAAKRWLAE